MNDRRTAREPGRRGGQPRCSFCGRAKGETSFMHAGPEEWLNVCNGCVYEARATRAHGPGRAKRCSFCGAGAKQVEWIFGGTMVAICNECVDRCVIEIEAAG